MQKFFILLAAFSLFGLNISAKICCFSCIPPGSLVIPCNPCVSCGCDGGQFSPCSYCYCREFGLSFLEERTDDLMEQWKTQSIN